jgi:hypothetical protein
MLVVALLSFILAIAIPTFFRTREISRQRSCQENLYKIDGAKEQWALENGMGETEEPTWSDLVGVERYLRATPSCPAAGDYAIGPLYANPSCTRSTQSPFPHEFNPTPPGSSSGGT